MYLRAVPDIILPRVVDPNSRAHGIAHIDQVYDVKTCGARIFNGSRKSSCGYCVPCSKKTPVQFMEDEVRSPRPESSTDRKEAKRAKATRLAAVHVVSESGIPADRGSFGA